MQSAIQNGSRHPSNPRTAIAWKTGSVLAIGAAFLLAILGLVLHQIEFGNAILILGLLVLCTVAAMHARFLYLARGEYRHKTSALETREIEFQSVFENALDAILILDGRAICCDANPSAFELFGINREKLIGQRIANFYPDRHSFDLAWERLLRLGHDRGQSEIARHDGKRVFVEFTAAASFLPDRHLISLRDVTERHHAEEAREKSLVLARSAWQEADGLRQATLALTQDLRMNSVLDTLLKVLHQQIPYEAAQVLLIESGSRLFLARESRPAGSQEPSTACPDTLDAAEYPILQRALRERGGLLISDTLKENDWQDIAPGTAVRSWLGIPLSSSNQVVGLLCATHTRSGQFTAEHLRIACSLAISASVAIQNARLYECAEIYASELARRSSNLQ